MQKKMNKKMKNEVRMRSGTSVTGLWMRDGEDGYGVDACVQMDGCVFAAAGW